MHRKDHGGSPVVSVFPFYFEQARIPLKSTIFMLKRTEIHKQRPGLAHL